MTPDDRWPQVGDRAVELRRSSSATVRDQAGPPIAVKNVTATLVITSDGEKYNRDGLFPASEGRSSARKLMPASDVQVLTAQGREVLSAVAANAFNLAQVAHRTPEDCVAALAIIIGEAHTARAKLLRLMLDASRAEQESER